MRNRIVRLSVVLVLVAVAAAAAVVVHRDAETNARPQPAERIDSQIDRLLALVLELRSAEATYVAPGQDSSAALRRFPQLLTELTTVTGDIGASLVGSAGGAELQAFADGASALAQADAAAREHLLLGDERSASHVIFAEGAAAADTMTASLVRLRAAARATDATAADQGLGRTVIIAGTVGAVWLLGLLLLALVPPGRASVRDAAMTAGGGSARAPASDANSGGVDSPAAAWGGTDASAGDASIGALRAVDWNAVADLCTEIGRVDTAGALTGLLTRAVTLLNADGIIVWMESAGRLYAVAAAGYPPETLARLSPIARQDDHAVAAAWRDASVETVDASSERDGALAVPLFNAQGCVGVLAVEVRDGREQELTTRAVARMLAAQLSTVVGGASAESQALTGT
jgi:hypothetical protein